MDRLSSKKIDEEEFQKVFEEAGYFILISSLPFKSEGILQVYYIRQTIEQYFDLSKGDSKLTPLRVHSKEALYGHLVLSMMSAMMNIYIMDKLKRYHEHRGKMFMTLANQKCLVYRIQVHTCEPLAGANDFTRSSIYDVHSI